MSTEPIYATSLETAKEGETVLFRYNGSLEAKVITRTTKTGIIVPGYTFNREGREKGGHYSYARIFATTPEELSKELLEASEQEEFQRLRYDLRDHKWGDLTLDQLRQVSALVQSFAE